MRFGRGGEKSAGPAVRLRFRFRGYISMCMDVTDCVDCFAADYKEGKEIPLSLSSIPTEKLRRRGFVRHNACIYFLTPYSPPLLS